VNGSPVQSEKGRNVSSEDIVRAWKDPDYVGDSADVDHPAGAIALDDDLIGGTFGGCTITVYQNCTLGTNACGGTCSTCGYTEYDELGLPKVVTYCV
jgi:mersacidin/lichenicidin family type 2 lantibiotic